MTKQPYHSKTQHSYSSNPNQDSMEHAKTSNNSSYSKEAKSVNIIKNNKFKVKKPMMPNEILLNKTNKMKILKCKKKSPNQTAGIHYTKMNAHNNVSKTKKDPIKLKQK